MKKLVILLFVSLAIRLQASDTYVYPPGLDSAIQHWQYPTTTAMNTDFGFYPQDVGKVAFNTANGIYYYLSDTAPTWIPMATGGGGGSTTFIGLLDVPTTYTGSAGKLVAVNGTANGLIFQTAAGGGNVSNVGTPSAEETAVWTDATHIKNVRTLSGGSVIGYVLSKLSGTDYDYAWVSPTTATLSITATNPVMVAPSPITGTGVISLDPASDLMTLEGLTGTNTIYYRSGTSAWSPVVIGSNLTFVGGTLAATVSGGSGSVTSISATSPILLTPNPITTTGTIGIESGSDLGALEALTGTNTIYYRSGVSTWSAVGIGSNMTFTAGSLAAGNANWDTAFSERRQWDGSATNLNATLGRGSLGATTIGANIFTAANPVSISWMKVGTSGGVTFEDAATTKTSLGLNTANWDTAYTDRMKWDTSLGISGGTAGQGRTALGATTAGGNLFTLANPLAKSWVSVGPSGGVALEDLSTTQASLGISNVTNDAQTKAAVMPNTAPAAGQIPIGGGTSYVPRTMTGDVTIGSGGSTTVTNVVNTALVGNGTITIAGNATALGGAVSQDAITGLSGLLGIVKRTTVNTLALAVAGTDYKLGTLDSPNVRLVTTTSTYTPTAGIHALYIECIGGGGGGGGAKTNGTAGMSAAAGGGGGGGYAAAYVATPAASYAVTIGAAGGGGAATGADGNPGGATSVGATSVCTATGGAGGQGVSVGAVGGGFWGAGAVAGVGTVGALKVSGGDGGVGMSLSGSGQGISGVGGSSHFTGCTTGVYTNGSGFTVAGNASGGAGGGGSGAACSQLTGSAGGAGSAGVVRVWEIF